MDAQYIANTTSRYIRALHEVWATDRSGSPVHEVAKRVLEDYRQDLERVGVDVSLLST